MARLQKHPRQPRIDRHPRHQPAGVGENLVLIERANLAQGTIPLGDRLRGRRIQEGKVLDVRQAQRFHPQDHARQRAAADLRIGELRPLREIFLVEKPHADPFPHPSAAPLPLPRAGLRHRLDLQALHPAARAPAAHPREPAVHHADDPWDRQGSLRHIGREDDPALRAGRKDPLLVPQPQSREQGEDLGIAIAPAVQGVGAVADLALAWQEHQHVAVWIDLRQPIDRPRDMPGKLLVVIRRQEKLLHGKGPAFRGDHGSVVEECREGPGVQRGGGNHQLQVRATLQQPLEVAEQEVDVQRPLVGFVQNQRVVLLEVRIALRFGEQDPVGHELDPCPLRGLVLEAHLIADEFPQRTFQFLRHPLRHARRRDPPRLGAADLARAPGQRLRHHLRQLRRLPRTGFADHHDHRIGPDRGHDFPPHADHRQAFGIIQGWRHVCHRARGIARHGGILKRAL